MHSRGNHYLARLSTLFLGSSILLVSCGPAAVKGPGERKELTKVTGTVTINGQPTPGVSIVATPTGGDVDNPHAGRAVADANGQFTFSTYATDDGLPEGEHVLTFTKPIITIGTGGREGGPPDELGGQYSDIEKNKSDAKFKFTVTVGQELVLEPIDLKKPEGGQP